ncbi:MAG: hypothetical protein CSA62_09985 [Planctomycetota bacterium]|nr:MAG: hypothetical protein CSA62_09985 [Planctomycetota bacterium]
MHRVQESERRRQIFVGGPYQRGLVLRLVRVPMLALAFLACLALVLLPILDLPLFAQSLVLGAAFVWSALLVLSSAIRTSARISGAEHALRCALERIRAGDWTHRVRLRHRDELQQLSFDVNALLNWLESHPPSSASPAVKEVAAELEARGQRDAG